jgi:hypothetical protein
MEISSEFSRQVQATKQPSIFTKFEISSSQNRLVLPIPRSFSRQRESFINTLQPSEVGISKLSQANQASMLLFEPTSIGASNMRFENKQITPQQYELGSVNQFKIVNRNKVELAQIQQQQQISRTETKLDTMQVPSFGNPSVLFNPPVITPRIPPPTFGFPGISDEEKLRKKKKKKKGKTALTPTLRSVTFGLTGKTTKASIASGLGERYVNIFKRRR